MMEKKLYLDISMKKIRDFSKKCKKLGINLLQIKNIENLLKKNGGKLFIIGGNVRDLILEKKISSSPDLVSNLPIKIIVNALENENIRISKVGLKFSSIVLKIDGLSMDLTSMRKDLNSDGRWANTKYTNEILEDAGRRDFTINSIYCDTSGKIYDPFNGIKDLTSSKVKFIGSAEKRIKEDYLRILRFLRFSYCYSDDLDKEGANACRKLMGKIKKLSFERIIQELEKTLVLDSVKKKKVIKNLSPFIQTAIGTEICSDRFNFLCNLEQALEDVSFVRRLKFLIRKSKKSNIQILNKINSKIKKRILTKIALPKSSNKELNFFFYNNSKDLIVDQLIEDFSDRKISKKKFLKLMEINRIFKKKKFPINGNDLIKIGLKKGKKIGLVLEKVKKWWIQNNFRPTKMECEKYAVNFLPTCRGR